MNKSKLVLLALLAVFTTSAFAQKAPHHKKPAKHAAAKKAMPKMQCCCMGMMGQGMKMGQMGHMGMMPPQRMEMRVEMAPGAPGMPGMHPDMMQMHGQMGMMGQMDPDSMERMMAASARVDDAMKALDAASADGKLDAAIAVIKAMNDERKMMHAMMHRMMGGPMRPPMPMDDHGAPGAAPAGPPPAK